MNLLSTKTKQRIQDYFDKRQRARLELKKEQLILSLHKNQVIIEGDTFYTIKKVKSFFGKITYIKVYGKDIRND